MHQDLKRQKTRPFVLKPKIMAFCMIVLLVTIIFFPVKTTYVISGDGQVLTTLKQELGDCTLSIEIKEIKSLIFCYNQSFSFILDGTSHSDFVGASHAESWDGFRSISQAYYDESKNRMTSCFLVYNEDLSYGVIGWNEKLYFVNPGASIPVSEIPIS